MGILILRPHRQKETTAINPLERWRKTKKKATTRPPVTAKSLGDSSKSLPLRVEDENAARPADVARSMSHLTSSSDVVQVYIHGWAAKTTMGNHRQLINWSRMQVVQDGGG